MRGRGVKFTVSGRNMEGNFREYCLKIRGRLHE
jgi:hypothetical protein